MSMGDGGALCGGRTVRVLSLRSLPPIARLRRGTGPSLVEARHVRDLERIDAGRLPPRALVAGAVDLAVVHSAERDDEFIAHLAAERTGLGIAKMVGNRWLTAADQAWQFDDGPQGLTVAVAAGRPQWEVRSC